MQRTEGWVTGLQLAAVAMQSLTGADEIARFVDRFGGSHRYVIDYMVDEVLERQPPEVRQFLLQTSLLTRMTAPLCDAVTERRDGREMLDRLDRANLFVIPLDAERRWYRYHHLFGDLLRQRTGQSQRDWVPEGHARAFEWYAQHGEPSEAIRHALLADDAESAADLIERVGLDVMGRGQFTTVQHWIEALPENLVRRRPRLCVYRAWAANFAHRIDAIEPWLRNAEHALGTMGAAEDGNVSRTVQGHIATLRAWSARREHDNQRAIALLREAADSLGNADAWVRAYIGLNLDLAYLDEGALLDAFERLRAVAEGGRAGSRSNELARLMATGQLAAVLILQGRLHAAAKLCRRAIWEQTERHGQPPPACCLIYLRLGWVLAEWGDVAGYYENVSRGVVLADRVGRAAVSRAGSQSMAWEQQLLAEQGIEIELPQRVAAIMDRQTGTEGVLDPDASVAGIQAQNVAVYMGDDGYFEVWPGYSDHARAKWLASEGRESEALQMLADAYESAGAVQGIGLMIEARSSQALIYQARGDMPRALYALIDALQLGQSEGYVRTYADRGEPMARLLSEALGRGIMPEYIARILDAFGTQRPEAASLPQATTPSPAQGLIEPLSPRELEVLALVAEGLSNRAICERLYLALPTVKGHNGRIYAKLGVSSRTQAVARARELGLL